MSISTYASFLAFALALVLMPGPDFAVVTKNTLVGGRRRGGWSAVGVATSNSLQGAAAVAGLGALIVHLQPLFETLRWAGVVYLLMLAGQALRSALRGDYTAASRDTPDGTGRFKGWRQGFLSNITNPKVLLFYLAVLPQFLGPHAAVWVLLVFALSHAMMSLLYLLSLVTGLNRAHRVLSRRNVRRGLDIATGSALIGFSARLVAEQA